MQFVQARSKSAPSLAGFGLLVIVVASAGCHDGPMYALKQANPMYSVGQWGADERLGPTDAERAKELQSLMAQIDSMPPEQQGRWVGELAKVMEHDGSPYMRSLAVRAAGRSTVEEALTVIETGLDDDDFKVRMCAASALSGRQEPRAVDLLAETVNSDANKDVRLAAIKSLGTQSGSKVTDALKLALKEPELAYQYAAIASLKNVTGKDVGDQPKAWIAMLESEGTGGVSDQPSGSNRNLTDLF